MLFIPPKMSVRSDGSFSILVSKIACGTLIYITIVINNNSILLICIAVWNKVIVGRVYFKAFFSQKRIQDWPTNLVFRQVFRLYLAIHAGS